MARVTVRAAGIRELLNSREVADHLHDRADRVAAQAASTAPVDTGEFAASFDVVDDRTDRAVARVITTDPDGLAKEARFRTMTSALDAAG